LTKEKFTAQSNIAISMKKSVEPNFLGSSIGKEKYSITGLVNKS
jgi:hypothetical protein